MDTLTHAVFGALAGQAVEPASTSGAAGRKRYLPLTLTAVGAAFPDIDYVLFPVDPLLFLAEWHRSFTHSLVLAPVWVLLISGLIVLVFPRLRKDWLRIGGFITLGLVSHIVLDLLTVYGTKVFYPLSSHAVSLGTTFVIDPILSLIVLSGLMLSFRHAPRITATVSIVILCAYVLLQWQLKTQAREFGKNTIAADGTTAIMTTVLPQPFSPFHWRIINHANGHYTSTLIDLAGISEKLSRFEHRVPMIEIVSAYHAPVNARWSEYSLPVREPELRPLVREAWQHDGLEHFRSFARYPVLYRVEQANNRTCVWFSDLRYHLSTMIPSFRYGMCLDNSQAWQAYRLEYFTLNDRRRLD